MGIKITFITHKGIHRISVVFDSLQYKRRSKTFKDKQFKEALDFAYGLQDRYVMGIEPDLHDWAIQNGHSILKKSFDFA